MRYVVIGAGAVGGSIGAALFAAGHQVVLVARGPQLAAITGGGLKFATPRGISKLAVPVVSGPDHLTLHRDDVLILAVKVQDSVAALDLWSSQPVQGGRSAGSDLPLFCAQNGVEGERLALRRFDRVYGVTVVLPASYLSAGEIAAFGDPLIGSLVIGRYPNGSDELVTAVCAELRSANIAAHPDSAVMRWKYAKLLSNLGNALEAIGGPIEGEPASELLRRARAEGEQVLRDAGIEHAGSDQDAEMKMRLSTADIPGLERGGGSTWQSLRRGAGSVEADYLAGEIVLLGRLHSSPTPVNRTLCRLVGELVRRGGEPGSMSFDQVRSAIDAEVVAIVGESGHRPAHIPDL